MALGNDEEKIGLELITTQAKNIILNLIQAFQIEKSGKQIEPENTLAPLKFFLEQRFGINILIQVLYNTGHFVLDKNKLNKKQYKSLLTLVLQDQKIFQTVLSLENLDLKIAYSILQDKLEVKSELYKSISADLEKLGKKYINKKQQEYFFNSFAPSISQNEQLISFFFTSVNVEESFDKFFEFTEAREVNPENKGFITKLKQYYLDNKEKLKEGIFSDIFIQACNEYKNQFPETMGPSVQFAISSFTKYNIDFYNSKIFLKSLLCSAEGKGLIKEYKEKYKKGDFGILINFIKERKIEKNIQNNEDLAFNFLSDIYLFAVKSKKENEPVVRRRSNSVAQIATTIKNFTISKKQQSESLEKAP